MQLQYLLKSPCVSGPVWFKPVLFKCRLASLFFIISSFSSPHTSQVHRQGRDNHWHNLQSLTFDFEESREDGDLHEINFWKTSFYY